ncbi:MAG: hypothetical protein M3457_10890 [Chloroflexota bacterium]|nr:hypothetical protein [Chloroflexota bacterium]
MVDLEELEMTDLGESDGFDYESLYGEGGEFEASFDNEGGEFEEFEEFKNWGASYEDLEADPFIGDLVKKATRVVAKAGQGGLSPKFFQQLAGQAARVAGGAVGGKTGADIASQIAGRLLREGDAESSYESESSYEHGAFDPEVLDEMHYNAYQAAEAESEFEADPFIADLVGPLISGLASGESDPSFEDLFEDGEIGHDYERDEFLPALLPLAMPLISKGVGAIGKMLSKNKKTRKLTRCLPKVLNETVYEVQNLRRQPTQRDVAAALGRQSARAFGSPQAVSRNFRQNRMAASRAQMRPSPVRRPGGPRPGSMSRGPMDRPMRPSPSYGRSSSGAGGGGRRRGPVVGYMLKPIYARSRS